MSSYAWKLVLILGAACAVYLVGNARTQLFDRDEPRYAQCSRQMLLSGDWVVPRLYDRIRAAKPPGIYWCQATAMELFGDNAFAARFPSAVGMVLTAMLLGLVVWRAAGPAHAVWSAFIFCSSLLTIVAAKICLTDSVLLLWTSIALLCVALLWRDRGGWPAVVGLAVSIGVAGLIKGPFILGVLGGTIAVLWFFGALDRRREKRARRSLGESAGPGPALGPTGGPVALAEAVEVRDRTRIRWGTVAVRSAVGVVIVAAIVLPWVLMVHHRAPEFLGAAKADAMQHLESGAEGHKGPPGYHLALIWFTFLPWSLLLPVAIGMGFAHRREPAVRFALAAVLGTWVFVEILQTKLPHYMLAAFPPLAFLTADAIVRCLEGRSRDLESTPIRIGAGVFMVAAAGLATAPWWWLAVRFHSFPWAALVALGGFGVAYGGGVWWLFSRRRPLPALLLMGCGAMVLAALFFGVYFPVAQPLRLSTRVAEVLKAHDVVHSGQVLMLDYKEPSLAFAQGGTIREAKHSLDVLDHFDTAPPWMVMTREIWDQTTPAVRARLQIVGRPMKGLAYSEALRQVEVLVVRKKQTDPQTKHPE